MSGLHLFVAGREKVSVWPKNVTSERHQYKEDLNWHSLEFSGEAAKHEISGYNKGSDPASTLTFHSSPNSSLLRYPKTKLLTSTRHLQS